MAQKTRKKTEEWDDYEPTAEELSKKKEDFKTGDRGGGAVARDIFLEDCGFDEFTPHVGKNVVRIIPPLEIAELKYYGFELHFHRLRVGGRTYIVLCPNRTRLKKIKEDYEAYDCPEDAKQTSELWDSDPDLAKTYYPTFRVLMFIQDKSEESEDTDAVLVWRCPKSVSEEIIGRSENPETGEVINIASSVNGRYVYFDREGTKMTDTKYKGVTIGDTVQPLDVALKDKLKPLSEVLDLISEEEFVELSGKSVAFKSTGEEDTTSDPLEDCEDFGTAFDTFEECGPCDHRDACKEASESGDEPKDTKPEEDVPGDRKTDCDDFAIAYNTFEECNECEDREICKDAIKGDDEEEPEKDSKTEEKAAEEEKEAKERLEVAMKKQRATKAKKEKEAKEKAEKAKANKKKTPKKTPKK